MKSVAGGATTFYVSGDGQRVAQRVGSAAPTYLLVDHLGSTRYVLDNNAQTLSAQRYFPWGSSHFATNANALPRRQYTGQMNDGDTDLYYYNARYYEPGLARFIQADTIVPEPGDPQILNRYTYVRNNPLIYTDPSGHDIMLVGGWHGGDDDWEELQVWEEWIRYYKGWEGEEGQAAWEKWSQKWRDSDDAGRTVMMETSGIHIFNWNNCNCETQFLNDSQNASVDWAVQELERQMRGMQDITLIGHSKGGNVVLNYIQDRYRADKVKNTVLLSIPTTNLPILLGSGSKWTLPVVHPGGAASRVVTIYHPLDFVSNWFGAGGGVAFSHNIPDLRVGVDPHDRKGYYAKYVLVEYLRVEGDHNARKGH